MKRFLLILVLILFGTFFLVSCKRNEIAELRFVEYTKITPEAPDNKKEFFGYIKAGGDMELSFETAGVITKINFTDGESVKKGQVIAEIDNKILELEEKESRAELSDAYIQYENAKNYYERINKLHLVGGISENDWDKAKTQMESKRHQIEIAKEQVAAAKKRSGYGKLYAPDDGIVLRKLKEPNQYTDPGQPVVLFQDNRKSEAKIFVSQKYINDLYTGKTVEIKTEEDDKTRTAKIKSITKTSIDEGAYRATVIFDKKYPELKDGMAIRAVVEFKPDKTAEGKIIRLPVYAVLEDEISSYVWVLEDVKDEIARVKRKDIKVDTVNNNYLVVEGLRRNELVVTKGAGEIMNGQRVKIKSFE